MKLLALPVSLLAVLASAAAQTAPRPFALANFSLRARLDPSEAVVVGGAVTGGSNRILFRAAGPVLSQFGVAGAPNPRVELYGPGGSRLTENEDWPAGLAPVFTSVAAFPFPAGSKDAALIASSDGLFTAHGRVDAAGDVLLEVYNLLDAPGHRLTNLSARLRVGDGQPAILGFATTGSGTKRILIRAIGQTLGLFGVVGTMADPTVQVYDASRREIAANDNWDSALDATFQTVKAFALPALSTDAAVVVTAAANTTYTVHVSGADLKGGDVLIEVYELP